MRTSAEELRGTRVRRILEGRPFASEGGRLEDASSPCVSRVRKMGTREYSGWFCHYHGLPKAAREAENEKQAAFGEGGAPVWRSRLSPALSLPNYKGKFSE